jgi:hypothetical protein
MFRCQVCGATEARSEVVSEVFLVDGLPVLVDCRCWSRKFPLLTVYVVVMQHSAA